MKKLLAIVLVIVLVMPGCATMQEYQKTTIGAAAGTILGAGLGYAIGGGKGATAGAVIGGLLGACFTYLNEKLAAWRKAGEFGSVSNDKHWLG